MADVIEKEMVRVEKIEEQAEAKYEKNKASSKGMSKVCPVCYAVSSECARCAMLSRASVPGVLCCLDRVCPVCYAVSSECVRCAMLSRASVCCVLCCLKRVCPVCWCTASATHSVQTCLCSILGCDAARVRTASYGTQRA